MRHYEEGAAKKAISVSKVPFINAGDGKGQHPTQSLLDLYTIYKEFGKIDGLTIAMVGVLLNGRTVHSLAYLLSKFEDIKIIFVSPNNLKIKNEIKEYLEKRKVKFEEKTDLNEVLKIADVIYLTRIQRERMNVSDYEMAKGKYSVNSHNLGQIKSTSRIMHPLPHVEEIDLPIEFEEKDKRVAYFRQAENGVYARMALLEHLLT